MKNQPLTPKFPKMLHGGDYNPEQWMLYPDILQKDIELMQQAHINCVSLGIFSWADLEPEEGVFTFGWLDQVIDDLWNAGIRVILATPSGARPHWLAEKYPEVLRVSENGLRNFFGHRHNHCYTSPVYREKVGIIDRKLAVRYSAHPGVILWHISNEFGGECFCDKCQAAFRVFLKQKYGTLEQLNHDWWAHFWSHSYTSWEQIEAPSSRGETSIHGLTLDWKRFVTQQTTDFMRHEIDTVKSVNPDIPVTANFMEIYNYGLDYYEMAAPLDVISWDAYPEWHVTWSDEYAAMVASITHDMMRSLKHRSFLLMENTPGTTNWRPVSKLKKPGMHTLSIVNAIAHGADSGLYFQIRQSRGSCEKFHSAVISHTGTANTRIFREVMQTGQLLEALTPDVYSTNAPAQVAILHDVACKWALDCIHGPRNAGLDYFGVLFGCYHYFWKYGITTDIVNGNADFSGYSLLILPMQYLWKDGLQARLRAFVQNGGTLVTTAFTGIADSHDLCFLGEDTEEKLSDVMGYWIEETDALYDEERNFTTWNGKRYELHELCEILHPTTAEVLSVYETDFYAGSPVLTCNTFGKGRAYHIAASATQAFYDDLFAQLSADLDKAMPVPVPAGMSLTQREDGQGRKLVFVQNFANKAQRILLPGIYTNLLTGESITGEPELPAFGYLVLREEQ